MSLIKYEEVHSNQGNNFLLLELLSSSFVIPQMQSLVWCQNLNIYVYTNLYMYIQIFLVSKTE